MKEVVVVLTRLGFWGLVSARSMSQAWTFSNYQQAEEKLQNLYREHLSKYMPPQVSTKQDENEPIPDSLQGSFYDAERGQFKICGDAAMTIGVILIRPDMEKIKCDLIGVNQGPNPEV